MAFDYAGAKAAGYSDNEIQQYLNPQNQPTNTAQTSVAPAQPQQTAQPDSPQTTKHGFFSSLLDPIQSIGQSIATPFVANTFSDIQKQESEQDQHILQMYQQAKSAGNNTRANNLLKALSVGKDHADKLNFGQTVGGTKGFITPGQVAGGTINGAAAAATLAGLPTGSIAGVGDFLTGNAGNLATKVVGNVLGKGLEGAAVNGTIATGTGLSNNQSAGDIAQSTLNSMKTGGIVGGVFGGLGSLLSPVAKSIGNGLLNKQFPGIDNPETVNAISRLRDYGVTKIKDFTAAHDATTGANGLFSKLYRGAIQSASPVDTTGIQDMAQNLANTSHGIGDPLQSGTDASKFVNNIKVTLQKAFNSGLADSQHGASNLPQNAIPDALNPSDAFGAVQQLEKLAYDPGSIRNGVSSLYKSMASELESRITQNPSVDTAIQQMKQDPEVIAQVQALAKKLGSNNILKDFQNIQSAKDLRTLQQPFVIGDSMLKKTASLPGAKLPNVNPLSLIPGHGAAGLSTAGAQLIANKGTSAALGDLLMQDSGSLPNDVSLLKASPASSLLQLLASLPKAGARGATNEYINQSQGNY